MNKTNKKKNKPTWLKPLIIAVCAAVAVIGIVLGVVFLAGGDEEEDGFNWTVNGETELPDDNFDE